MYNVAHNFPPVSIYLDFSSEFHPPRKYDCIGHVLWNDVRYLVLHMFVGQKWTHGFHGMFYALECQYVKKNCVYG